jgi:phosphatidylglycerophosphatase A
MNKPKLLFSREEMQEINIQTLKSRGVEIEDIAKIAWQQQSKYTPDIPFSVAVDSVMKILSYRDIFHYIQLGVEIDRLAEERQFKGPIQDILFYDLGLFGVDEVLGLEIAGNYGAIGKTNFGDIDVNKPGIVKELNELGKNEFGQNNPNPKVHTMLDDIVGALAASASTRIAQVLNEETANEDPSFVKISIFDVEGE